MKLSHSMSSGLDFLDSTGLIPNFISFFLSISSISATMGFISRLVRDRGIPSKITGTNQTSLPVKNNRIRSESSGPLILKMDSKPSFGQWIKVTWHDLLTMLCMGIIGLGVYFARPAPSRSFPVYFQDGEIVYPQFAYPLRKNIIPIWAAAIMASLIPILIVLLMQIRIRSFWDANNAIIGLLYSLITAAVFQVFLKWLIGGLRPHFLTVCKPIVSPINPEETVNGLRMIMYDRKICTGNENEINDSLESFPSGHSTAAFAGFVFLTIYLNAKLKVWSNYHSAMWKMVALWAPILGATLIASSLTIDEFHNWYDCFAGAMIGTFMAFSSYRMVFASLWDYRTNHIPLNREVSFTDTGIEHTTFTRKVGFESNVRPKNDDAKQDATRNSNLISLHQSLNQTPVTRKPVGGYQIGDDILP